MITSGIYAIVNIENGKVYIGSTIDFERRHKEHEGNLRDGAHGNPYLQHSWNKYGEKSFHFGILEYLDDPDKLHIAEQFWMDIYRKEGVDLYNVGLVARAPWLGCKHTKKSRQKIGEAARGRKHSDKAKCKMSIARMGHSVSKETRRKVGDANRGRKLPPRSKETRLKMSDAARGNSYAAKLYPDFVHEETGEIILAGVNLVTMCRRRGLSRSAMCNVKNGKLRSHKGWILSREDMGADNDL